MTEKFVTTNVEANIGSVSSLEELEALFAKIKVDDPARYARLEEAGELELQKKVLGLEPKKAEKKAK